MELIENSNPRTEPNLTRRILILQYEIFNEQINCKNFPKNTIYSISQNIIYNIEGKRYYQWKP